MKINSENDLKQAFAAAASGARVVIDPSSPAVTVTSTIQVEVTKEGFYFDGSGLQIATNIPDWGHLLEFTGGKPGLQLKNIWITGSYPNRQAGDGIRFVNAPSGNETSFHNFILSGIRVEHVAGNGMYFEGSFEADIFGYSCNDIGKSGMVFSNGSSGGSVVCQINVYGAQLSRCDGWGAEQVNGADQVTWHGPVFVNNGMGGIHATDGIHLVINPKMENSGETMVVVDSQAWGGAEIISPGLAGDGSWTRSWVTNTGPTKYVVKCPPGAVLVTGVPKLRAYGGPPLNIYAPGSAPSKTEYEAPSTQYTSVKPGSTPPEGERG